MLSAVITALLLVLMVAIVTSFIIGGWREHLRHKKMFLAWQASAATHPLGYIEKPVHVPSLLLPASWYTRHRTLVSLGFLGMVLLALFLQDGLTEGGLRLLSKGIGSTFLSTSQANVVQTAGHATPIPVLPATASVRLIRIDSTLRGQYHTDYQWQVWSYSSCSGMAMTMVMNAYGRHLIAADVLQEELNLGVWNVSLGLLREEGIAMTATYYGFDTNANHTRTVQDLITIANKGAPIIVGIRDSYYYPGGHLFVVRGGDNQYVYIADSSRANFQRMSYSMFLNMWQGFSAVLTPRQ
ncbi:MAG: hypothetical protein NVS4B11_06570 [Ktedonobacteraceae bacterium]